MVFAPVWIAGAGMTPFGIHRDLTVKQLTAQAVREALADASATTADVEAVFFANTTQSPLEGQHMVPGQIAVRELGIQGVPVVNVENACASGASAFHLAVAYVRSGAADIVLAVGAEKMNVEDRSLAMSVFDGAYDVSAPEELARVLRELGGETDRPTGPSSSFMDIYAAMARSHMDRYGTTQRQLAVIAEKNHRHSMANHRAHYRKPMSADEVLAARALAFPLTVPMCAPITDGAAAVIVCSERGMARLQSTSGVRVLASALATGSDRDFTTFDGHVSGVAAQRAYEQAGLGPDDIDVAEVHDATAFGELLQLEVLGLYRPGEAAAAGERGATSIGGALPVNPSGGLVSKGHPLAATGLGQIFELAEQLRGRAGSRQVSGARVALAENGGGFHRGEEAVASVILLGAQ